jgi:hypothetical protein
VPRAICRAVCMTDVDGGPNLSLTMVRGPAGLEQDGVDWWAVPMVQAAHP